MNGPAPIFVFLLSVAAASSGISTEIRALRVDGNPRTSCHELRDLYPGSTECLIGCLADRKTLLGFGWNRNTSLCRCCLQKDTSATKVDGLHWETYMPACSGRFVPVVYYERYLCHLYEARAMNYSSAEKECLNMGADLVDHPTDFVKIQILVRLTGKDPLNTWYKNNDDTGGLLKPYVCEKDAEF